ncbi:hypothetical protein FRB93_004055 [Tulasnella sp. JGI-2019a]|nr:hypothetical protein FRB93_004055 [Tulasnella sp. JGI-2019a]
MIRFPQQLLRSINIWSRLRHNNVLSLTGFHLSANLDVAMLICPLEPLGSVDTYLQQNDVDLPSRMQLVAGAARGLQYLHNLDPPVTHGDIKGANTLINQQPDAILCDFGLAKSQFRSGLETQGQAIGSIPWCAPKLFDEGVRSSANDVWSLGCLVLEIVKGIKPFAQHISNTFKVLRLLGTGRTPASKEDLQSPINLWSILEHCCHFEANDRLKVEHFSSYWHILMHGKANSAVKPICPNGSCTAALASAPAKGGMASTLEPAETHAGGQTTLAVGSRNTKSDNRGEFIDSPGKVLSPPLEALPRAKGAAWSATARASCLEETRLAVMKDIQDWIFDIHHGASPFFDLDGIAGIGKTTIAYTLAKRAAQGGYLGASLFFSRSGEAELRNPALVFPTLAYQLCGFGETFYKRIEKAVKEDSEVGYQDLQSQFYALIVGPLQQSPLPSHPILVVLDALDECQEQGAKELLRLLLLGVPKIAFPLKVFITSRPESHIRSIFSHTNNIHRVILHDIELSVIKNDIRLYLQTSLAAIKGSAGRQVLQPLARPDEIEILVERAGKLFSVATMFVRLIDDIQVPDPRQRLDSFLQRSPAAIVTPNKILGELYLQVLRNIQLKSGDPYVRNRVQAVVGAIVVIRDRLPVSVMELLMKLPPGDGSRALHHLHSVIQAPRSPDESPYIHHTSFTDFITNRSRCTEPDFLIVTEDHELRMATWCLELMKNELKKGMACDLDSWLHRGVLNINNAYPTELQYACRRWSSHLLSAPHPPCQNLVNLVGDFTRSCLMWWLEAMSCLGSVRLAASCLEEAISWATTSRVPGLSQILKETLVFIIRNFKLIDTSAWHIYLSALSFVPPESSLFALYFHGAI